MSEIEATLGYEFESSGLRPEIGLVLGLDPDTHVPAPRPALVVAHPSDPGPARPRRLERPRPLDGVWLLLGVAAGSASRASSASSPRSTAGRRSRRAGVPLLVRGGATFRF